MDDWQPIETAPKDGTEFLCYWRPFRGAPQIIIARWNMDMPWVGFHGVNVRNLDGTGSIATVSGGFDGELRATHWMPLPEPPSQ